MVLQMAFNFAIVGSVLTFSVDLRPVSLRVDSVPMKNNRFGLLESFAVLKTYTETTIKSKK